MIYLAICRCKKNIEELIVNFLRSQFAPSTINSSLEQQYSEAAIENKSLVKDFAHADLEGWESNY